MTDLPLRDLLEIASFLVTIIGLPFAIGVFIMEQRRERANEEEEIYLRISDAYRGFMELVLQNADLQLRSNTSRSDFTDEQQERRLILFHLLVSLFEQAYMLIYEERMSSKQLRMWQSWEDFMREWCLREDFRVALPELLAGEDPAFAAAISRIADEEARRMSAISK